MSDEEEVRPVPTVRPKGLDSMSVAELEAHIVQLKMELEDARKAVDSKRQYRSSLDDLFSS